TSPASPTCAMRFHFLARRATRATEQGRLIMKTIFAIAAAAMTSASLAADRPQDRWNLADLYPSVEAWNADAQKVESQFTDIAACKGHLGDSAARMRECLDLQSDTLKRYFRLAVYANELYAEDTG